MNNDQVLHGSCFAVTGAASGIGKATVARLLQAGADVIGLDRICPEDSRSDFLFVDLADPDSIAAAAEKLPGNLAGLLNIAGVPGTAPPEVLARVNYLGLRLLTQMALPKIIKEGSVVNVASTAGENWRDNLGTHLELAAAQTFDEGLVWLEDNAWPRERAYAWFKEALIVWSLANAATFRSGHYVRMNCVSPGPVDTPILDQFRISLGEERVSDALRRSGGAAKPDDIAAPIVFLASAASSWVAGTNFVVDGGASASRLEELHRVAKS